MVAAVIAVTDLTTQTIDGTGVFDVMMKTVKAHLKEEYDSGRIKGNDYSTVYLGALQGTMDRALQFVLSKDKVNAELALAELEKTKVTAETLLIGKQDAKVTAETLIIPKQGLQIEAQTLLVNEQKANAVLQGVNLGKEGCKLDAEFDVLEQQVLKVTAETALMTQKKVTELAQVNSSGVDADSVIGKQKALYTAQTTGFTRDAELKVAGKLIDTWNVRRTTDDAVVADAANGLLDANILRAVNKMLDGVGA